MKKLLRGKSAASQLFIDVWQKDADQGRIAIIGHLDETICRIVQAQIRYLAHTRAPDLHLFIDCAGTPAGMAWPIIGEIARYPGKVEAFVDGEASSGGFSLALAADRRVAVEGSTFCWHGPKRGDQSDDALNSIDIKVAFYASRTKQSREFWEDTLTDDMHHSIDTAKALEWGILHKVVPATYSRPPWPPGRSE